MPFPVPCKTTRSSSENTGVKSPRVPLPPTSITPPFPITPINQNLPRPADVSSQGPSPADSSYTSVTPVVVGLGNDVGHLVELVMDHNKAVQNVTARLGTLESCVQTNNNDLSVLVTGAAEGVGTLGRDFTSVCHDLRQIKDQQGEMMSAVHELGSVSLRNFFNLPVTSGKQIRCSFCSMSGK